MTDRLRSQLAEAHTPEQRRRRAFAHHVALRDRAVLLFGFGGGFRAGELAALEPVHLDRRDPRMLVVTVLRAKNLRRGKIAEKIVPRLSGDPLCPVDAVNAWLDARDAAHGEQDVYGKAADAARRRVFSTLSLVPGAGWRPMRSEDIARRVERRVRELVWRAFFGRILFGPASTRQAVRRPGWRSMTSARYHCRPPGPCTAISARSVCTSGIRCMRLRAPIVTGPISSRATSRIAAVLADDVLC
jgi:hypothetical protein